MTVDMSTTSPFPRSEPTPRAPQPPVPQTPVPPSLGSQPRPWPRRAGLGARAAWLALAFSLTLCCVPTRAQADPSAAAGIVLLLAGGVELLVPDLGVSFERDRPTRLVLSWPLEIGLLHSRDPLRWRLSTFGELQVLPRGGDVRGLGGLRGEVPIRPLAPLSFSVELGGVVGTDGAGAVASCALGWGDSVKSEGGIGGPTLRYRYIARESPRHELSFDLLRIIF